METLKLFLELEEKKAVKDVSAHTHLARVAPILTLWIKTIPDHMLQTNSVLVITLTETLTHAQSIHIQVLVILYFPS